MKQTLPIVVVAVSRFVLCADRTQTETFWAISRGTALLKGVASDLGLHDWKFQPPSMNVKTLKLGLNVIPYGDILLTVFDSQVHKQ